MHLEELCQRRIYHSFNPQGVNIIAASLLTFGTDEQKQQWAVPVLRGREHRVARHERAERRFGPGVAAHQARRSRDGDDFVVNGQKVWTSGAHDADLLLTFVRTDPDAPKHKGISVLIIPTDTAGVVCRPFADICGEENKDFNEVFFTDVRVPAENLVGPLNGGWGVANGSLGHERTMMWLGFADRIANSIGDFQPSTRARARPVRQHDHGLPGAAAARFGRAGQGGARRGRRRLGVGAQAVRRRGRDAGVRPCAGRGGLRRADPSVDSAGRTRT